MLRVFWREPATYGRTRLADGSQVAGEFVRLCSDVEADDEGEHELAVCVFAILVVVGDHEVFAGFLEGAVGDIGIEDNAFIAGQGEGLEVVLSGGLEVFDLAAEAALDQGVVVVLDLVGEAHEEVCVVLVDEINLVTLFVEEEDIVLGRVDDLVVTVHLVTAFYVLDAARRTRSERAPVFGTRGISGPDCGEPPDAQSPDRLAPS